MSNCLFLLPINGASREASINLYRELEKLLPAGKIRTFDTQSYLDTYRAMLKNDDGEISVDIMNQSIIVSSLQYDITHLFVPALAPVTLFTLQILQKAGVKTSHWFIEDFRRAKYWRSVLPGYNNFIAVQKGPLQEACGELKINYKFIPTAVSVPEIRHNINFKASEKEADCAFIGIPSEYRVHFLEEMAQDGRTLRIAGEGWQRYRGPLQKFIVKDGWVNMEESIKIMQSCRSSINLSFTSPEIDASSNQISPRLFDILGTGIPLITEDIPLLQETAEGYHFRTFLNSKEASRLITDIINTDQTILMSQLDKNRKRVQQKDSWKARAEDILEFCQ